MKSVVLLSGGMDSVTALYWASQDHAVVGCVSFDYGSKHNHQEIPMAAWHAQRLGVKHDIIGLDFVNHLFASDLLQSGGQIPDGHYAEQSMKRTVVPFRNGIMLSIACGLAESREADAVVIAAHSGDHAIYPDCREPFMQAMAEAMKQGTYAKMELLRPFIDCDKAEIVRRGMVLAVDYAHTWSCYKGGEIHCGQCGTCVERREAFLQAGAPDPTAYASTGALPPKPESPTRVKTDGTETDQVHDAREALKKHFGFRAFLDGQEEVIANVLAGRDSLIVMPTGGGKSLCYQLPALVMDGVTIVVSPLIALMKDQVDALVNRGISATLINSTLTLDEQKERISGMRDGGYKLVYVAPERFRSGLFLDALRKIEIALFAVDEAHCLSQWGHDFRPDYLRLGEALEKLDRPQVLALTATATGDVREDIMRSLRLRDPYLSVRGFSRPNLSLNITHTEKSRTKYDRLREIITHWKTGIVYCATRKHVEEVTGQLAQWKVKAIAYHGGLDEKERGLAQNKFIQRKANIAVATNAFGMGIDRSDVRFVAHFDVPGSVEAYYQEAGRAGRDGEPSHCELFFNFADTRTQEFFIEGSNPSFETIQSVFQMLLSWADNQHEVHASIDDIADHAHVKNSMAVGSALSMLARQGLIERFDIPGKRIRGTRLLNPDMKARDLQLDRKALAEKDKRDRSKLKAIIDLCYADKCRQQMILEYFGEQDAAVCGNCDACRRGGSRSTARVGMGEEIEMLRKALSGVARMSQRDADGNWVPRFGKGRIVAMLLGSKSREVVDAGLDELTTYGILKRIGTAGVHQLFKEMEKLGFIETITEDSFPLLRITAEGVKVMRTGGSVKMLWPDMTGTPSMTKREAKSSVREGEEVAATELGFDEKLFEKLKKKRLEISQREGIPPFMVFHNNTLEFFTRLQPKTLEDGRKVRGVGEAKAQKWLAEFVGVITAHH